MNPEKSNSYKGVGGGNVYFGTPSILSQFLQLQTAPENNKHLLLQFN